MVARASKPPPGVTLRRLCSSGLLGLTSATSNPVEGGGKTRATPAGLAIGFSFTRSITRTGAGSIFQLKYQTQLLLDCVKNGDAFGAPLENLESAIPFQIEIPRALKPCQVHHRIDSSSTLFRAAAARGLPWSCCGTKTWHRPVPDTGTRRHPPRSLPSTSASSLSQCQLICRHGSNVPVEHQPEAVEEQGLEHQSDGFGRS